MRHLTFLLVLSLVPMSARAADDDVARAKELYEKGMARFQLEEYGEAIALWQNGFRLKPLPGFLYNIAQAYRLWNHPDPALSFYKKYLTLEPGAHNRSDVERLIDALEQTVDEQRKAANVPPANPVAPGGRGPGSPESIENRTASSAPDINAEPKHPDAIPRPSKKPLYTKNWFWGVIACVAVVTMGAGIGIGLGAQPSDPTATYGRVRGN